MSVCLNTKSIYYDDINLIAQLQFGCQSRKLIPRDLSKIIISPMSSIVGEKFAIESARLGFTVCLHRFCEVDEQIKILNKIYDQFGKENVQEGWPSIYVSAGLNDHERINKLKELEHFNVVIDTANGYLANVVSYVKLLQNRGFRVIAGNVHSAKGFNLYQNARIRVGLSNGSACFTKNATGYNRGQVTEILECYNERYSGNQKIVADGGIKDAGRAAKAFGLGADEIMLGGYFAHAEESQNIIDGEFKYWGGASHLQQIKQHGEIKRHTEGKELDLDKNEIKPLKVLADELWGGISSAISYSGFSNLTQFIGNATYELKS